MFLTAASRQAAGFRVEPQREQKCDCCVSFVKGLSFRTTDLRFAKKIKDNRSSHDHKTNYYISDVSFCLFRKYFRLFKMSNFNAGQEYFKCLELLFPSYFIFFSIFSLFNHNKLSCPVIRFPKTSHQSHKWQQKQQQEKISRHRQSLHVSFISLILAVRCFIRVLTTDLLRCK